MYGWFILCALVSFYCGRVFTKHEYSFRNHMVMRAMADILDSSWKKFAELGLSEEEILNIFSGGHGGALMGHLNNLKKHLKDKK